jgi:aminoglycoside phosphotransferase (APT) family kinase protein
LTGAEGGQVAGRGDLVGYSVPIRRSALDLAALRPALRLWLVDRLHAGRDLRLSAFSQPVGSGAANETLLFDASWTDGGRRRRRGLVARLAAVDPLHPIELETHYRMYSVLGKDTDIPVPPVVGYEADKEVVGVPFFVMERVEGQVPPDNPPYPAAGWVAEASPGQRRRLWEAAVDLMARLHRVEPSRVAFLAGPDGAATGLEQSLEFWAEYCAGAAGGSPHPVLETGLDWLRSNVPSKPPTALAWGDARIGNMIFRHFRPVAVLDWDMVSLAGGESDLAWWILREHPVADLLPGIGTAQETVDQWERGTGWRAESLHYQLVFAALRLGAIRLRLARQHAGAPLGPGLSATDNGGIQQLALLLGLRRTTEMPVTLPRLDI